MAVVPEIEYRIPLPHGVTATLHGPILTIAGPKGSISRRFEHPKIDLSVDGDIVLRTELPRRKVKALIGTWRSHVKNMIIGVSEGFRYVLKIKYSHFPMKVTVREGYVMIENFLGERHPRRAKVVEGTSVSVKGDEVVIEGIDREKVGQCAANIELATKTKNYDPRVFQDGIYLVSKGDR